ncbi:MAG: NUDIX hydrolase [Chitinispirillaceae bacterium]|nr:NUDIX hydrolase [Chitinispirillaceae bacterium]
MKKTDQSGYLREDSSNYDKDAFEKPSVTVDVAVCTILDNKLHVLLIRRPFPPFKNYWALPGGFVNIEKKESLEDAARRKLEEKTGIENVYFEQLKTYGEPSRDPRMRIITVAYYALVPSSHFKTVEASSPEEPRWFPLDCLPEKIAFDHRTILFDLLIRLRGKISYSPIVFSLLENKFTWTELQSAYEIILGKKLLAPNFRRKLLSMYNLKEIEEKQKTKGRPSTLLVFENEKEF